MPQLYKVNAARTIDSLVRFWKRKAQDRILIWALVRNPHWDHYLQKHDLPRNYRVAAPGYALTYFPEDVPACETKCLCTEAPERVMEMIDVQQRLCADLEDDSLPIGYPCLHFGESVFSGFAGGAIRFAGNGPYTWSAPEAPVLPDWDKIEEVLTQPLQDPWRSAFESMARFAVERAGGRFGLRAFITIDTLNLAVEWRGGVAAYLDTVDAPDRLERIYRRGVALNHEVMLLERTHYDAYNRCLFGDEFCALAPAIEKPLLSVDAFTQASPGVYAESGVFYQQQLIDLVGGGHMHMHGTRLYRFLPLVARLQHLISIELGDDGLQPDEKPPVENIRRIQEEVSGDTPLLVHCTREQFLEGMHKRTLAGGVAYCVREIADIDDANQLVAHARDYVPRR